MRRMLDVGIPGNRRRGRPNLSYKYVCKRDMTQAGLKEEIHQRGQRNKQGSMEKEDNQLNRRHQMTGQARNEEDGYKLYIM